MNNNEMLLLKLGEVVLKGLNRRSFEDKLVTNVRRRMKQCGSPGRRPAGVRRRLCGQGRPL